jgi:hypothetical protein
LYLENLTTQIPKRYEVQINNKVVNTEPIEKNGAFFCFIPNLNNNDVDVKTIKTKNTNRQISINEILSDKTSCKMVFCMITSEITMAATATRKIIVSTNDKPNATKYW